MGRNTAPQTPTETETNKIGNTIGFGLSVRFFVYIERIGADTLRRHIESMFDAMPLNFESRRQWVFNRNPLRVEAFDGKKMDSKNDVYPK